MSDLDKLYSSISVAGDSQITLTKQQLDEYISEKVEVQLNEKLKDINNMKLTGIKQDTSIEYYSNNVGNFNISNIKMTEKGNIGEYLVYSEESGDYTVLKSGFYIAKVHSSIWSPSSTPKDSSMKFYLNGKDILYIYTWADVGKCDANSESVTVYLEKGDKIYFSGASAGASGAGGCSQIASCYPMF